MSSIGFIGLGNQGAPMARRLLDAGHDVMLWARRPASLEAFAGTPAVFADSIESLAAQVTVCGVCVVDDAGVQQVCESLIPAMRPGSCIAIHATVHPQLCRTLAVQAAARDIALIDAPVSGGGPAAAAGTLTVMAGGDRDVVDTLRPLFAAFASAVVWLGPVGAGQAAKLVNNTLMAANLAVAHHALRTAEALGLEREAFADLVKISSGRSFSFEVRARMAAPTDFRHGAELLAKDVRLLGMEAGSAPAFESLRAIASTFLGEALADDGRLQETNDAIQRQ